MQIGLAMNTTKTKYMQGMGSKNENPVCLTPLAVDGDELEEVDEFVYLRSLITADNNISKAYSSWKSCLFWTTEDTSIRSSATPHEADAVQNLDTTGYPLRS